MTKPGLQFIWHFWNIHFIQLKLLNRKIIGFDSNNLRIRELLANHDRTGETNPDELANVKKKTDKGPITKILDEKLDALKQAREYSKTCSLRETASWLHRKTGRYISHVGLRKRLARNSTTETEENSTTESQEVS